MLVLELARCEYILRRENILALGNSGTGKTHIALALGLAACQKGFTVAFTTAASLVNQLMEARDERRLLKLQRELSAVKLLVIEELDYVPLSPTGAELLFETFSQRDERGSTIVTSNVAVRGLDVGAGVRTSHRRTARSADPPRSHHDHERLQLPPQAIRPPPPCRNQGRAKPGHQRDHRSRHRGDYTKLTRNAANDMQRGPIGPLCISSCRAINGLLLLRHAGLEADRH